MFDNIKKTTKQKKTHKEVAVEQKTTKITTQKKPSKSFKEGNDGFVRSTISIPNNFGKFLHEEVLHGGIKKKKMTEVIMSLLEEKYGRQYKEWMDENE